MAELVDAADSKSAVRKDVLVRFQSRAQKQKLMLYKSIDYKAFLFLGDGSGDCSDIFIVGSLVFSILTILLTDGSLDCLVI